MIDNLKKCNIYFSNTDYLKLTGGTEKFLKDIIEEFKKNNIDSVQIFPIQKLNRAVSKYLKNSHNEYVGINVNGSYYGTFEFAKLSNVFVHLQKKYKFVYQGIIINQINNFSKKNLAKLFKTINLPIKYIVHDFTSLCPYIFYPSKTGVICETDIVIPSRETCGSCNYLEKAIANYKSSKEFFDTCENLLDSFIFPSENAYRNWEKSFQYSCNYVVRPHLSYNFCAVDKNYNKKTRLAFIGQPANHKGLKEWLHLIEILPKDEFEFYYLGNSDMFEKNPNIITCNVDYRDKNSLTMQKALKKFNIDVVFLWSKCMETYSYTYYESLESGCYVVTNNYSGNIADSVVKNVNGKAFDSFLECQNWFLNCNYKNDLKLYFENGSKICNVSKNLDLYDLRFDCDYVLDKKISTTVFFNPLLYVMGKFKFFQL